MTAMDRGLTLLKFADCTLCLKVAGNEQEKGGKECWRGGEGCSLEVSQALHHRVANIAAQRDCNK